MKSSNLSKYVQKHNLIPYTCAACGNTGQYNGKKLTLQIDHINGKRRDNRLENLRFLCPNCHSQTDTFAGRACRLPSKPKKGNGKRSPKVAHTIVCAKYAELQSFSAVARALGISHATARRIVVSYL